jgi:hypothetical protein
MKNKSAQIKKHLLSGKSITGLQALSKYGCYRLSSVIHRLRKDGYEIATKLVGKERHAQYKVC